MENIQPTQVSRAFLKQRMSTSWIPSKEDSRIIALNNFDLYVINVGNNARIEPFLFLYGHFSRVGAWRLKSK